jgi:hypothetical protein
MTRTARNTVSVLFATVVATLAIFASVQYGIGSLAPEAATAASLTCPATGCTASSCHATQSGSSAAAGQSLTTDGSSGSNTSVSSLTCPRTGCTASSCHATAGGGAGGWGGGRGYSFPG